MEYYEDAFQSEQDAMAEICVYYTLDLDGAEYYRGSYEDCLQELERLVREHAKDGCKASDFSINTHSCTL